MADYEGATRFKTEFPADQIVVTIKPAFCIVRQITSSLVFG